MRNGYSFLMGFGGVGAMYGMLKLTLESHGMHSATTPQVMLEYPSGCLFALHLCAAGAISVLVAEARKKSKE